jgi:hypothetical protein
MAAGAGDPLLAPRVSQAVRAPNVGATYVRADNEMAKSQPARWQGLPVIGQPQSRAAGSSMAKPLRIYVRTTAISPPRVLIVPFTQRAYSGPMCPPGSLANLTVPSVLICYLLDARRCGAGS